MGWVNTTVAEVVWTGPRAGDVRHEVSAGEPVRSRVATRPPPGLDSPALLCSVAGKLMVNAFCGDQICLASAPFTAAESCAIAGDRHSSSR